MPFNSEVLGEQAVVVIEKAIIATAKIFFIEKMNSVNLYCNLHPFLDFK